MKSPSSELERHERSYFFGICLIPGKQGDNLFCRMIGNYNVRSISAGRFENVWEAFALSNTPTII